MMNEKENVNIVGDDMKRWIQLLIMACLVAAVVAAFLHNKGSHAQAVVGDMAPNFQLSTFDGKKITLQDLRGKPVFVNFWASWCENCKDETPDLIQSYDTFKTKVQFVGIDLAAGDQEEQAKQFIQSYHIPYTILADLTGDVGDTYQVNEVPTSYFIDRQGKIVSASVGTLTVAELNKKLSELVDR